MDVQELERRAPLDQQVLGGTGPARGRLPTAISRSSQTPRQRVGVDPAPDRPEGALGRAPRVRPASAGRRVDALDHAERGQELQVQADAHEPPGSARFCRLWTMSPTSARV